MQDSIVILNKRNRPYPWCKKCNMFVVRQALLVQQPSTDMWQRGEERKRHQLAAEEARLGTATAITVYGFPLVTVPSLKYLGRILSVSEYYWPEVVHNLRKAQKKWVWLSRVLVREGADAQRPGLLYVSVVQAVLLYGSEMRVTSPHIGRKLSGFHYWLEHRLKGRQLRRRIDGIFV